MESKRKNAVRKESELFGAGRGGHFPIRPLVAGLCCFMGDEVVTLSELNGTVEIVKYISSEVKC